MPSLGADMTEGTLLEWLVQPGDTVHRGDIVAVVDTSKSAIDIEVFEDGVVERAARRAGHHRRRGHAAWRILGVGGRARPEPAPAARRRPDPRARAGERPRAAPAASAPADARSGAGPAAPPPGRRRPCPHVPASPLAARAGARARPRPRDHRRGTGTRRCHHHGGRRGRVERSRPATRASARASARRQRPSQRRPRPQPRRGARARIREAHAGGHRGAHGPLQEGDPALLPAVDHRPASAPSPGSRGQRRPAGRRPRSCPRPCC